MNIVKHDKYFFIFRIMTNFIFLNIKINEQYKYDSQSLWRNYEEIHFIIL